ncbi:MAG: ligand-binding sensor domain-containing protein [Flavobacteriaceae bacterium]|jgi:ligand-binding sensor domain-containing protein
MRIYLFFITSQVLGQGHLYVTGTFPSKHYTKLDGLPSNEYYVSLKDDDGYLWIATEKGVSHLNVYEFENFIKQALYTNS